MNRTMPTLVPTVTLEPTLYLLARAADAGESFAAEPGAFLLGLDDGVRLGDDEADLEGVAGELCVPSVCK